jgi:hypothetical protein
MDSGNHDVRETFWIWQCWEESVIKHLSSEDLNGLISFRANLVQAVFTVPDLRLQIANCIDKQIGMSSQLSEAFIRILVETCGVDGR